MQLDELKNSMSTLEQVLAKTNTGIMINVSASESAKTKILRKYRQNIISCAIIAIVFGLLWIGNVNNDKLPNFIKAFISILNAFAAIWYIFLFSMLKKIDIACSSPVALFKKTATLKLLNLTGEILMGIAIVILFTLFFQHLWLHKYSTAFWTTAITLAISLAISAIYIIPKYLKLFRDLNSIK
ncbi:MAG: hypothetical protein K2M27_09315 [Muribaculaceae bacterium]|nr:hypothetical protein [Muribaculaceae bacterium]